MRGVTPPGNAAGSFGQANRAIMTASDLSVLYPVACVSIRYARQPT